MPEVSSQTRRVRILEGDLRRTLFLLALPVLCEQFLSFCVGFVDTYLAGTISVEATNAIGLAAYVGWLASMSFGLVGIGTTALVAREWGAGAFAEANRITNRSMALAAVAGGLFYIAIFVAAPGLARLLEMPAETSRIMVRYLRLDGLGHLFTSLSLIGAAALRGAGDMRSPMLILGLVNVLNVIVSASLVFGVGPFPAVGIETKLIQPMGIDGIVIGTVTARIAGGLMMIGGLCRGLSGLQLLRHELRIRGETARRILRIGGPAAIDGAVMWAGHFLFLMVIANLSDGSSKSVVLAAHYVGIRVEAITYLPAVAWGFAAATMIGQSLGAQERARAIRAGHEAALQCSLLAVGISIAFYFGAPAIYGLMHKNVAVHDVGIPAFRMLAFFQVPLVISIIYVQALRGAGDTRYPLVITLIGVLGVRLPVAYYFGIVLQGGLFGAWIGMCGDMVVRAILVSLRYLRGRWVETNV